MRKLFINSTHEIDGVEESIAVYSSTVSKNISEMYNEQQIIEFNKLIEGRKPFYSISRFGQYVVYVEYDVESVSMRISDFKNSTDAAIDRYLALKSIGWRKQDIEKIMRLTDQCKAHQGEVELMMERQIP